MSVITVGPFAIPLERIVLVIALVSAVLALRWFRAEDRRALEPAIWIALVAGVVAARLVYVAMHWDAYRSEAWRALALWEDGYAWSAGIVVGLLAAAGFAGHTRQRVVRLVLPAMAGAIVWMAGSALVDASQRDTLITAVPSDTWLEDLSGRPVMPAAYLGKPTVLNLWATWCPPCRREMPALAAAQQQRADVNFVFVNQGEGTAAIERFLHGSGLQLSNIVLDPQQAFGSHAGNALPTTLFFDARGRLADVRVGELSPATLSQRLGALSVAGGAP